MKSCFDSNNKYFLDPFWDIFSSDEFWTRFSDPEAFFSIRSRTKNFAPFFSPNLGAKVLQKSCKSRDLGEIPFAEDEINEIPLLSVGTRGHPKKCSCLRIF